MSGSPAAKCTKGNLGPPLSSVLVPRACVCECGLVCRWSAVRCARTCAAVRPRMWVEVGEQPAALLHSQPPAAQWALSRRRAEARTPRDRPMLRRPARFEGRLGGRGRRWIPRPLHARRRRSTPHPSCSLRWPIERCRSSLLLARSAVVMSRGLVCVPGRVAARGDASGMKLLSIEEKLHPSGRCERGGSRGSPPSGLWRSPHAPPPRREAAAQWLTRSPRAEEQSCVAAQARARSHARRPPPSRHPPSERRGCSRAASSSARPRRRLRCASPTLCSPCSPSQLSFCCQGFSPCLAGRDVASL